MLSYVDFQRCLIRTAVDLSKIKEISSGLDGGKIAMDTADAALHRLEDARFVVAVVGEFRRGKSTFLNALLGCEILPSDVVPTTATVNRIVYGFQPGCTIVLNNGERFDITVDRLSDHVTKITDASAAVAETVREAVVRYPAPFCRNNIELLDTPGLADNAAMTARTLDVLSDIDVAILLVSAAIPMSSSEQGLLRQLLLHVDPRRVFVVVNQIDRLRRPEDIDRSLNFIRQRVLTTAAETGLAGTETIGRRVFALSALGALEARAQHLPETEATGFSQFEQALEHYLSADRGLAALQRATESLIDAIGQLHWAAAQQTAREDRRLTQSLILLAVRQTGLRQLREEISHLAFDRAREAAELTDAVMTRWNAAIAAASRLSQDTAAPLLTGDWGKLPIEQRTLVWSVPLVPKLRALMATRVAGLIDMLQSWPAIWQGRLHQLHGAFRQLSGQDPVWTPPPVSDTTGTQPLPLILGAVSELVLGGEDQRQTLSWVGESALGGLGALFRSAAAASDARTWVTRQLRETTLANIQREMTAELTRLQLIERLTAGMNDLIEARETAETAWLADLDREACQRIDALRLQAERTDAVGRDAYSRRHVQLTEIAAMRRAAEDNLAALRTALDHIHDPAPQEAIKQAP